MSRGMKRLGVVVVIFLLLGTVVFVQREKIALALVGFMVKQRVQVGPNQDVVWSTGTDPRGRAPDERPPNISVTTA